MSNFERAVELILDASSSMKGQPIKDAKEVLKRVIANDLPDGIPIAVRVYGLTPGCSTELVRSLTPLTPAVKKELQKTIAGIQAVGNTNIAGSLAAVEDDLARANGERHVVLVTDGNHNCPGSVEEELEKLKEAGFDVQVDIVGFAPPGSELHETFREWAKVTDGLYLEAHDSDKLEEALREALKDDRKWWEKVWDGVKDIAEGDVREGVDEIVDGIDDARSA